MIKKAAILSLVTGLFLGLASQAQAVIVDGNYTPLVTAGAPPDTPADRVDPNTAASPFSGVVSINIRYANGDSFICSGTLVSKRTVISAGHCVDADGNGHLIDIHAPGNDVRVVFNSGAAGGGNAIITASNVVMNPNYQGFGNCPAAVTDPTAFCVNDDLSVVTLSVDAPASAKIYKIYGSEVNEGQLITMVGYGRSGDGASGYYTGPDFRIKRQGENYMDLFDRDDEQNFASGGKEVWYADFDGAGKDTFCTLFGVCTPVLPGNREANIGGGDSGGPSFVKNEAGEYLLLANNTFGGTFAGQTPGAFGTYFGGILLSSYIDWLQASADAPLTVVPEPGSLAILGLGLGLLLLRRRARA